MCVSQGVQLHTTRALGSVYSLIAPLLFHCSQADSLEAEAIVEAALSQFGKDHVSLM